MRIRKKTILGIIVITFLMTSPVMGIQGGRNLHFIKGVLYLDYGAGYEIAPEGVQIVLEFPGDNETTITFEYNKYGQGFNYKLGFYGHDHETGAFKVMYQGDKKDTGETITIQPETTYYFRDLYVTVSSQGNNPPVKPSDPSPADGASNIPVNPTLSVYVDDPDGDKLDVYFYNASDNSVIKTLTGQNPGSRVSAIWPALSKDSTYSWYVTITDGMYTTQSSTWTFTTVSSTENNPPFKPSDPSPADGASNVALNPTLSVYVDDPDGDVLDVFFYNAENNVLIGEKTDVSSSSRVSMKWSGLMENTSYSWYVNVTDGQNITQSDTWSFTTKTIVEKLKVELKDGLGLKLTIKNKAGHDLTNIKWDIDIKGGLLNKIKINKTGNIPLIKNNEMFQKKIPLLGLGSIKITIHVSSSQTEKITKKAEGFVFIIFTNIW